MSQLQLVISLRCDTRIFPCRLITHEDINLSYVEMALPPGFKVNELQNTTVADPICEDTAVAWTAGYKTGQDFHIQVDVPDTSPGSVYGLNQTLLLALRSGIYGERDRKEGGEEIHLWRTPPQQENRSFNFKGEWLDTENPNPTHPHFSYYTDEAIATTEPRDDDKDAYRVTLRMRKTPRMSLPTQIQRKSNPKDKLTIKQFDVQEMYLITLFRDEDQKKVPLIQWRWAYKYAWGSVDGKPEFVPHPGFVRKCELKEGVIGKYRLEGPSLKEGGRFDHFRVLDDEKWDGHIGEVEDWKTEVTEEWEACD